MTKGQEAFVGSKYEKGEDGLPRLLFISLDTGGKDANKAEHRTAEAYRYYVENECDISQQHKSRHWYRTNELALEILTKFRPQLRIENIGPYFAHTNSAKCCSHTGREANWEVFENCRIYVRAEIPKLRPDIVITQGEKARRVIEGYFDLVPKTNPTKCEKCLVRIIAIGDTDVLWIHTPHPRNFGPFNKQRRECWGHLTQDAKKFWRRGNPG